MKKILIALILISTIFSCAKKENPEIIESILLNSDGGLHVELVSSEDTLIMSKQEPVKQLVITNNSSYSMDYQIEIIPEGGDDWFSLSSISGSIEEGKSDKITVTSEELFNTVLYDDVKLRITYSNMYIEILLQYMLVGISTDTDNLVFSDDETEKTFNISNLYNNNSLEWDITTDDNFISINPKSGSGDQEISVNVDRTGFVDGFYSGVVNITSNGGEKEIDVLMVVGNPTIDPTVYNSIPEAYKTDYFIENFDDNSNSWTEENTSAYETYITDGKYSIKNKTSSSTYFFINSMSINNSNDFEIETYIALSASYINGNGLVYDYTNATSMEFLYFTFAKDYKHNIGAFYSNAWHPWQGWSSGYITSGFNKLTVRKYGNNFYFFVNEELVYQNGFTTYNGNKIGFQVMNNARISVDYLTVKYINDSSSKEVRSKEFKRSIKGKVVELKNYSTY